MIKRKVIHIWHDNMGFRAVAVKVYYKERVVGISYVMDKEEYKDKGIRKHLRVVAFQKLDAFVKSYYKKSLKEVVNE